MIVIPTSTRSVLKPESLVGRHCVLTEQVYYNSSLAVRLMPYAVRLTPYALRLTPYAVCLTPFTLFIKEQS